MILNFLKGFNIDGKRKQTDFDKKIKEGLKIHTIRLDMTNRWKEGRKIHFSTGSRTAQYNCFKEGICKGIQKIRIERRNVYIDNVLINYEELELLSINDGFESLDDFWWWFDQYSPFIGKIIHWTNLMY